MMFDDEDRESRELPPPIAELRVLYPVREEAAWNALVSRIMAGARPALAHRRSERVIVRSLLRWARPVAAAAVAVLLFGAVALAMTSDTEAATPALTFAQVVDREPASVLLSTGRPPTTSDLAAALEGDSLQQVEP